MKWLPLFSVVLCSVLITFVSCSPNTSTNKDAEWTHIIEGPAVEYYQGGPQQSSPPDGEIAPGTKVKLITDSGSYSEIEAESGEKGFVSSASLKPIAE